MMNFHVLLWHSHEARRLMNEANQPIKALVHYDKFLEEIELSRAQIADVNCQN
jgi:hypothetical protein